MAAFLAHVATLFAYIGSADVSHSSRCCTILTSDRRASQTFPQFVQGWCDCAAAASGSTSVPSCTVDDYGESH